MHYPDQKQLLGASLGDSPLHLTLPGEELDLLLRHSSITSKFAFELAEADPDPGPSSNRAHRRNVVVTAVPQVLKFHSERYLSYGLPSPLRDYVLSSLLEVADALRELRGAGGYVLPKTVDNVMKSRACKGKRGFRNASFFH